MPELLDGTNHVAWFDAGSKIFAREGIQYLGIPGLINAKNIIATLIVQVSLLIIYQMSLITIMLLVPHRVLAKQRWCEISITAEQIILACAPIFAACAGHPYGGH